jgi:hypothetical protein
LDFKENKFKKDCVNSTSSLLNIILRLPLNGNLGYVNGIHGSYNMSFYLRKKIKVTPS